MKATNVVINGEEKAIFKDPVTDDGLKKSLKGRIAVALNPLTGKLVALDDTDPENRADVINNGHDLLQTVWEDGRLLVEHSFKDVRERAQA